MAMKRLSIVVKFKDDVMHQSTKDVINLNKHVGCGGIYNGKTRRERKLQQLNSLLLLVNDGRE